MFSLPAIPLLAAAAALAGEPITATFLGNQAFKISDGGTTLYTDFPYQSGAHGYMRYDESVLEPTPNSYCLITHGHRDHFAAELVSRIGCTVIGPASVLIELGSRNVLPLEPEVRLPGVTVRPIETPHSVEHYSYRVNWGDVSFYLTGDTEELDALRAQPTVDVLFISPWLYETALRRQALPQAAQVLIYHHTSSQRVPSCRQCDGDDECIPCRVPRPGESFTLAAVPGDATLQGALR